jgi:hypothetical protein
MQAEECAYRHFGNGVFRAAWVTQFGIWEDSRMPWNECNRTDERLRFVARLCWTGEGMTSSPSDFQSYGLPDRPYGHPDRA